MMNWVVKRARSVEILLGDRELGSLLSVIDETLDINGRGARCEEG